MNSNISVPEITVVIICCDDERVFQTINSVDGSVPVIVSLVPNKDLENRLLETGVRIVLSQRGNYSISCNRGLAAVETKCAFIIDSDCLLHPECLEIINDLLQKSPIARAKINFQSQPRKILSKEIADWHSNTNNQLPIRAYTPGLGLQMDILQKIGGYYFDERIFWSCDSEFSYRVKRAGFELAYSESAIVSHAAISFPHFVKSGFKLGMGTHAQVKLGLRIGYESPSWIMRRFIHRINLIRKNKHHHVFGKIKQNVFLKAIWTAAFYCGYYAVFFHKVDKIQM